MPKGTRADRQRKKQERESAEAAAQQVCLGSKNVSQHEEIKRRLYKLDRELVIQHFDKESFSALNERLHELTLDCAALQDVTSGALATCAANVACFEAELSARVELDVFMTRIHGIEEAARQGFGGENRQHDSGSLCKEQCDHIGLSQRVDDAQKQYFSLMSEWCVSRPPQSTIYKNSFSVFPVVGNSALTGKLEALRSTVVKLLSEVKVLGFSIDILRVNGDGFTIRDLYACDTFSKLLVKVQKASGVALSDFRLASSDKVFSHHEDGSSSLQNLNIGAGTALTMVCFSQKIYECDISFDTETQYSCFFGSGLCSGVRVRLDGSGSCLLVAIHNEEENGSTSEFAVLGFVAHQTFDIARGSYVIREGRDGLQADCDWHTHLQKTNKVVINQSNNWRLSPEYLRDWEKGNNQGFWTRRHTTDWILMDTLASMKWSCVPLEGGKWTCLDLDCAVAEANRLLGLELRVVTFGQGPAAYHQNYISAEHALRLLSAS